MARAIALLLLLAMLTAGCAGGDDDDTDSDGTSTQTGTGGGVSASGTVSVSTTGTGAPSNNTHNVKVLDDKYEDADGNAEITIKRGDSINWTHMGQHPHSVTSDVVGLFDSSPGCTSANPQSCLQNGQSFKHEFDLAPGTYTYHCNVHPTTMKGTITVTN